jgi:hypothetical protein
MEKKQRELSRKTFYQQKIKEAAHLLLYTHHRKPGIKGWELRRRLGSDYPNILNILNRHLEKLDLQIKRILEKENLTGKPTLKQLENARFYVTTKGGIEPNHSRLIGWRIDDIAGLAVAISYIIAKEGKTSREELKELLQEKLPGWRVEMNLRRYVQAGYLGEEEEGIMFLDWRTMAEVDQKVLVETLLAEESETKESD